METKKHLIILILKLLETESDENHPLTQIEIADLLSSVYPCDRKTVGRNIRFLTQVGYPIVKTKSGFYLDKKSFTVEEIRFVRAAIVNAPVSDGVDTNDLLQRLLPLLTRIGR